MITFPSEKVPTPFHKESVMRKNRRVRPVVCEALETRTLMNGTVVPFGTIAGRNYPGSYIQSNGVSDTVSLRGGGSGTLMPDANGGIDLALTGTTVHSVLTVQGHGKPAQIDGIVTTGPIGAIQGNASFASGLSVINGSVGTVTVNSASGAIFVCSGTLTTLHIRGNAVSSTFLVGTSLGSDNQFGGTGSAADSASPSYIRHVIIGGEMVSCTFGVGINPIDGSIIDSNDIVATSPTNRIYSVSIHNSVSGMFITRQQDLPPVITVPQPAPVFTFDVSGIWNGVVINNGDPSTGSIIQLNLTEDPSTGAITGTSEYELPGLSSRTLGPAYALHGTVANGSIALTVEINPADTTTFHLELETLTQIWGSAADNVPGAGTIRVLTIYR